MEVSGELCSKDRTPADNGTADFIRGRTGEHEEIFRLICEKDEKGLEKALKDHLYFSMKRMRHAIEVDYKDYFEEEPEEGRFVI